MEPHFSPKKKRYEGVISPPQQSQAFTYSPYGFGSLPLAWLSDNRRVQHAEPASAGAALQNTYPCTLGTQIVP